MSSIFGYLLGSIPTGYLILKRRGINITNSGTGNVGAMNTFDITNSKVTGLFVFFIDAIKGLVSVYVPLLIFPFGFGYAAIAILFATFSHCYNPWLRFKGGRGLATSLGGTLLIAPFIPAIWLITWILVYVTKRDILLGNILATILALLITLLFPESVYKFSFPRAESISSLMFFTTGLLTIIGIRHIDPLLELLAKYNIINKEG
ncbi:MAG: glycerol-3-phosphate acyltransferase [Ignavibacteriaceae bacterium]|nr:glycerol-3-phosphate acyltransferase [Ignavibacteriaceae bacterium]